MNTKKLLFAVAITAAIIGLGGKADALTPPHDATNSVITGCGDCHSKIAPGFRTVTSFNSLCFNSVGCHRPSGKGSKKQLSMKDASDRFRNLSALQSGLTEKKHSSHGWKVPELNSDAGVTNAPKMGESTKIPAFSGVVQCTRCHAVMGTKSYPKFLQADPTGNYICFNCHASRRVDNVREPLPSSISFAGVDGAITVTPHYSHPVEVNYSTARGKKPGAYYATPQLASVFGYKTSASVRLYTTHNTAAAPYGGSSRLAGSNKGAVVCQSCHGPLHSADSNPYTFDNLSAWSRGIVNYSSSAGNLLRMYPIAGPRASNSLCLSCHNVQAHKGFLCGRCHTPHKKAGENNRYLILENISTPNSGKRPVQFISTSAMADRWTNQGVGGVSDAICQVCHTTTKWHRNYSTLGPTNKNREGHAPGNEYLGGGRYRFCPACHTHTTGFTPSGGACASCHNFPPADTYGKHSKHTNSNASYDWSSGNLTDARTATSYGLSCGRCHSPWAPYTSSNSTPNHRPSNYGDDSVLRGYTVEYGFKIKADQPGPYNNSGSYTPGTRGTSDDGANAAGSRWSSPQTGTCSNLYCHGQFYNGYTSNNPQWNGVGATQACGKCHGASRADVPGKTGGVNWGAHPRHVGNASEQYGSGAPNFRCNACHNATVQFNIETSISDRRYHVNGSVNVRFDAAFSDAASNYNGFSDYTGRKPSMSKPAYNTCRLIYCHSDGSRMSNYSAPFDAGAKNFPNWSSSNAAWAAKRCSRCHGSSYTGITAAMPGYATRPGKGNSHATHVVNNGFMCRVCHSATVNADNKSIADTTKHVNKQYDIKILRSYSGVYDSSTHTCSMVSCHGRQTTPIWGNTAVCQNCHLSSTGDVDKRIKSTNIFQGFSETAAKIYSTQWGDGGHGKTSGNYGSGNPAAARTCTDCHEVAVKHGTSTNPFRLLTAPDRPNMVCERCHGVGASVSGVTKTGIQTHASSVVMTGKHNFAIKCIDCHDPHGDNNARFMVHSTVARPRITGTRAESSNVYGQLLSNITGRNVDFNQSQYTSDYARKSKADRICQVCHTRTKDQTASDPKPGRFRWYSAGDKAHGVAKCTSCHSHGGGFKGAGCNGCHGFPPINVQTVLSGAGRTLANLDNRQRPSGNSGSEAATAGAHQKHFGNFSSAYSSSKSTICSFCHQGGMYATGAKSLDIEIGFKPFPDYTGSTQKYGGQTAVSGGYYGYSGIGMNYDGSMRCTVKCHGGDNWLSNNLGNYSAPRWNVSNSVRCGKCHGAKKSAGQGSWPTTNRHQRHAGTNTGVAQYDFMCKVCHSDTVMNTATTLNKTNHVNGQATFKFYTGTFTGNRVWSQSIYTGGDTKVNSGFGICQNLYCHSRGTTISPPYNGAAYPNYTANWGIAITNDVSTWPVSERCSFCHGSRKSAGGYAGITSAMPNQANQAHKKHVVDNGFKCYFCHSATVNSSNAIISVTNHVNKFKNISIISTYRTGQTMYSSSLSATNKTCKNIRCHAGRKTPNWTSSYDSIKCPDCHYSNTADTDNFTFNNFSGTAAQIYSTEFANRGHGKARNSGKYAFSNNSGAGKSCTNCHKPAAKHGDTNNYFRLYTSNPDRLCLSCHGKGTELNSWGLGFSDVTGIQSHTWNNISTAGYNGGKIKAASRGGWNFGQHDGTDQKKVKCVDCHDPHGDRNNYMLHSYVNMSGSDRVGRPNPNSATAQMIFTAVGGPQINWSSYVKNTYDGICQRCHSNMMSGTTSIMDNFNKAKYSNHNRTNRCTKCHKHSQGFKPSGCDGCHGYPPPAGPDLPNNWAEDMGSPNTYGLHEPHAKNPRNRPGITAENDVTGAAGFKCNRCHANTNDGADPSMGSASNTNAIMTQLTSVYGDWVPGAPGVTSVTDDTCSKIACHTPRYYTRQWTKPTGCDSCHGYRNKVNGEAFKIQTTGSHKIHLNYSTPGIAGTDLKKYGLRCSNCHYDWQGLNNYSTHYSSYVNMTANGPVNTIANMKVKDGQFYTKGRSFKGFTTGNETFGTCARAYCHGNFINGTTATLPNWKKGVSPVTCTSCHKGKANEASMPERHPKHVQTYGFACVKCHVRTTGNITTVIFNYSSHVNGRKDVYFNSDLNNGSGSFASSPRQCSNTYCHSKGYRFTGSSFTTRTTLANYTADWDVTAEGRAGTGKGCSFCHGNKTYAGITAAMPNQTSLWGNSHRTHVIGNKFRCVVCHSATVNAAGQIATYGNHVNGFKNITIIAAYKSGPTNYVDGTDTCSNVRCHASKTTPKWGTYIRCQDCHLSNTGDTDKRISANNTFQSFTAKANPAAPRIYSTAWANQGHGKASGNYGSGNQAANKTCTSCHKASVSHGTAGNPFRLYTINSVTGNPNTLCNDCHGATPGTPANKIGILTHASSVTQTGRHNFAIKCIDCHDPHGDNNTRFMMHSTVVRPRITGTRAEISNANGSIFLSATGRNVDFNQNLYSSDYAKKVTAAKICQVCHTRTFKPNSSGVTRFRWNGSNDNSHGTGKCINCHSHSQGFKGMACNACHGFPPASANTLIGRPGTNQARTMSGSTTAGAHQRHVNIFGSSNDTCNKCHSGGMATTSNENGDITLKFSAFNLYTGNNQKYTGQATVRSGFYGYSGDGITTGNTLRCNSMKCHGGGGWLTKSFGNVTTPRWNDTAGSTVFCGSCHGAKKAAGSGTWPTTNAHSRHAGTGSGQYDFECRLCHSATVVSNWTTLNDSVHVSGQANFQFNTADNRVDAGAYSGDPNVNSGFGTCEGIYCHSRGTDTTAPYDGAALSNYTAKWADSPANRCSYCHGNKTYNGITAAMPAQSGQAHGKHAVDNGFRCFVCHSNVVNSAGNIVSNTNHVNKFKNISVISAYRTAGGNYDSVAKRCSSVKCHGGKQTPAWGASAVCTDCHYASGGAASAEDSFTWQNFSGAAAKIYSAEWTNRGHGRSSGSYPFSQNAFAGKNCTNCHTPAVKHNQSNYFRIITAGGNPGADPNKLCERCHGTGSQLVTGQYQNMTGIQSHTWANLSTNGYKGGASGKAGWNFTPKCVDCHDPHGDKNNYMVHSYINMTGSDGYGRPTPQDANLMNFTSAKGGTQMHWSSYVRSDNKGICQRCHTNEPAMVNFNKNTYSGHNRDKRCTDCHKHRKGFTPTGCDTCHGYPPPNGPSGWNEDSATPSTVGAHTPHARNPKGRPGIPAENDLAADKGFNCNRCHGNSSNGQGTGHSTYTTAVMQQLTSLYGKWSKGGSSGKTSVSDDTCRNIKCHTPRYYIRQWTKPTGCDSCHGYRNKANGETFNIQTTGTHKTHVNYSTPGIAGADAKKYGFACTQCHVNNANNYSTHYTGQVNMRFRFGLSTAAVYNRFGNATTFKGFTTAANFATCSKVYCHGRFVNGTTATVPKWGTTMTGCTNCHKGKANEASMPERHPKHVTSSTYNFPCVRCHTRTTNNITTVIFNYSSHVNKRKDVYFDTALNNGNGSFNGTARQCGNIYCHSRGTKTAAPFNNTSAMANYTADWDVTASARTNGKPCSFCHGNKTYSGMTAAMPNYASGSPKANSHSRHVVDNGVQCKTCHASTVNADSVSIKRYNLHANAFYNVSVGDGKASGTFTYDTAQKKCSNVTCHGGAGSTSPAWGTAITCGDCHFAAADVDDFQYNNGTQAKVSQKQWTSVGHGRASGTYAKSGNAAANKTCSNCHSSSVAHGLAANPFRLFTAPDRPNTVCKTCHGTGGSAAKNGLFEHSSSVVQMSSKFDIKCFDCHDPHGDNNIFMFHSTVTKATAANNYRVSDQYGTPYSNVSTFNVDFTDNADGTGYATTAAANGNTKVCNVCHSRTQNGAGPRYWRNMAGQTPDTHNSTSKCTSCHDHKQGLKPSAGGESSGDMSCDTCHSNLFNPMKTSGSTYHHVLQNTTATGAGKYPLMSSVGSPNPGRRCLMCHVDHNIFRPDLNASSPGRAANLRNDATQTPGATSGRNTDFISGETRGGLCTSCHKQSQTKAQPQANDGSTKTLVIPFPGAKMSDFSSTGHASWVVPTTFTNDTSPKFNANCLKCHNDTMGKEKQSSNKFWNLSGVGLHDSKVRRIQATMGATLDSGTASAGFYSVTSIGDSTKAWTANAWAGRAVSIVAGTGSPQAREVKRNTATKLYVKTAWTTNPDATSKFNVGDPIEEDLCYRCHSRKATLNPYSTLGYDYYGIRKYNNSKAQQMYEQFNPSPALYSGPSFVSNTASPFTITMTGTTWATGQWKGAMFIVTGGTDAGKRVNIISNTATVLTVEMCPNPDLNTMGSCLALTTGTYEIRVRSTRHRIDAYVGVHRTDEYELAQAGPTSAPQGWFNIAGMGLHTGCTDCHNPHAAKPQGLDRGRADTTLTNASTVKHDSTVTGQLGGTRNWAANEWRGYSLQILDTYTAIVGQERMIIGNTADTLKTETPFNRVPKSAYYIITPKGRPANSITGETPDRAGNAVSNANKGVWGVDLSYTNITASPTNPNSMKKNPVFTKKAAVERTYEICLKCHSDYGWGNNGARFNIPDAPKPVMAFKNSTSSNIAREFNPNNLSHHAIFDIGKNQPIKENYGFTNKSSYYNNNWPRWAPAGATSTIRIDTGTGKARVSAASGGLPSTVIPGWYAYVGSNTPNGNTTGAAAAGAANKGWFQISKIYNYTSFSVKTPPGASLSNVTSFAVSAGLGNNFVPPYGPWSVISCADCHASEKSEPAGPHASSRPWILRILDAKIAFPWFNGTKVINVAYDASKLGTSSGYLCLNCHRADVYGYESTNGASGAGTEPVTHDGAAGTWNGNFPRVTHPVDGMTGTSSGHMGMANVWKIGCMNCHGGSGGTLGPNDTLGSIHGSNLGKNPTGGAGGAAAGSYSGKRLLNGANWLAVTRATTTVAGSCWTRGTTTDSVGTCNGSDSNATLMNNTMANYNFEGGADK